MSQGSNQTSSFSGPPEWLQNDIRGYLARAGEVAGEDYIPYEGQRVADLSDTTRAGIRGIYDMAHGHPIGDAAGQQVMDTLGGAYSNPYARENRYGGMDNPAFDDLLSRGTRKITDAYQRGTSADTTRRFALSNNFGGSAHRNAVRANEEALADQLGGFTSSMLNDQYNRSAGLEESYLGRGAASHESERGRQLGAVGAGMGMLDTHSRNLLNAVQAGDIERGQLQRLYDSNYGDFQEWRNYPRESLDIYGNALSRAMGGAGTQTTQTGPGPDRVAQGMGTLAMANMFRNLPGGGSK